MNELKDRNADLARTHASIMLFYDKGCVIARMREKYPDRENVASTAERFATYCKDLGLDPDPLRMPDRNQLLRRCGAKLQADQ